ncbi:putative aspartyl-tRNA synthetase protein [Rosellinia necatrix]|uniref:Putative aspartyl-tRNA synthetase protein n=1 Tax=Rosellinia necatrix TaxID=77044 RepID=A0A1S8A7P6_ROSNE|nr:putative aspartyl-tRNA synthetase protein [Rosellinia necatrix]
MQLDSDMEDGEVVDGPPSPPHSDSVTDLETARARLLAQLNGDTADGGAAEHHQDSVPATPATQLAPTSQPTTAQDLAQQNVPPTSVVEGWEAQGEYVMSGDEEEDEDDVDHKRYCEPDRALVNERATLNMILTVAGEFYGQRDLLEFRDPFGGL